MRSDHHADPAGYPRPGTAPDLPAGPEADGQVPAGRPGRQPALHSPATGRFTPDGTLIKGRVGADLTAEQGYQAARQVGLAMLATLQANLGSLNKVKRLIKTFGLVLCTPEFADQPKVMNGFSELMAEVFGDDAGVGARSAVGTSALPGGMAVEVECIFEVE